MATCGTRKRYDFALFSLALGDRAIVRVQGPVALPPDSCPEPDLAILRAREDFYAGAHPRPDDVLLVIEVSESSLDFDRRVKLPIYAAAGIREAWIVDIASAAIACHSDPKSGVYATARLFRRGETLIAGTLPDVRLSVNAAI
ncbi:MAG: Uma2 family endonuclease [Minisyncoccota bacterium]